MLNSDINKENEKPESTTKTNAQPTLAEQILAKKLRKVEIPAEKPKATGIFHTLSQLNIVQQKLKSNNNSNHEFSDDEWESGAAHVLDDAKIIIQPEKKESDTQEKTIEMNETNDSNEKVAVPFHMDAVFAARRINPTYYIQNLDNSDDDSTWEDAIESEESKNAQVHVNEKKYADETFAKLNKLMEEKAKAEVKINSNRPLPTPNLRRPLPTPNTNAAAIGAQPAIINNSNNSNSTHASQIEKYFDKFYGETHAAESKEDYVNLYKAVLGDELPNDNMIENYNIFFESVFLTAPTEVDKEDFRRTFWKIDVGLMGEEEARARQKQIEREKERVSAISRNMGVQCKSLKEIYAHPKNQIAISYSKYIKERNLKEDPAQLDDYINLYNIALGDELPKADMDLFNIFFEISVGPARTESEKEEFRRSFWKIDTGLTAEKEAQARNKQIEDGKEKIAIMNYKMEMQCKSFKEIYAHPNVKSLLFSILCNEKYLNKKQEEGSPEQQNDYLNLYKAIFGNEMANEKNIESFNIFFDKFFGKDADKMDAESARRIFWKIDTSINIPGFEAMSRQCHAENSKNYLNCINADPYKACEYLQGNLDCMRRTAYLGSTIHIDLDQGKLINDSTKETFDVFVDKTYGKDGSLTMSFNLEKEKEARVSTNITNDAKEKMKKHM